MYEFDYHRANDIDDALRALGDAEEGMLLAGGMTLIPVLKQRLAAPDKLVDLSRIAALRGISDEGDALLIGATTCHADVASSDIVQASIPALADLAGQIGDPQVRARGTIGGSLANSDPAADYPAAVLGLGATIITNAREIAADDYFLDLFETALDEGEIITAVRFPKAQRAAYMKFPDPASRFALVGVFVAESAGGLRVAVTGAGPCAFRVREMEAALSASFTADAIADIAIPADDLNQDLHASAEYRAHLVGVMARRAVEKAVA